MSADIALPAAPPLDMDSFVTLDVMLRIAMWDAIFTGGNPVRWQFLIDGLLARGAKL
jgi:hypothetical protein